MIFYLFFLQKFTVIIYYHHGWNIIHIILKRSYIAKFRHLLAIEILSCATRVSSRKQEGQLPGSILENKLMMYIRIRIVKELFVKYYDNYPVWQLCQLSKILKNCKIKFVQKPNTMMSTIYRRLILCIFFHIVHFNIQTVMRNL